MKIPIRLKTQDHDHRNRWRSEQTEQSAESLGEPWPTSNPSSGERREGVQVSMIQGVIYKEFLGLGGCKDVIVTCDEDKGRQILRDQCLVGHPSSCQLNGIVTPQTVVLSQLDGMVNDRSVHRKG